MKKNIPTLFAAALVIIFGTQGYAFAVPASGGIAPASHTDTAAVRATGHTTIAASSVSQTALQPQAPLQVQPAGPPADMVIPEHPNEYYASRTKNLTYTDSAGATMPLRLFIPAGFNDGRRYPLALSLHGLGERGSDNLKNLASYAAGWTDDAFQKQYPCFVLVPQCPLGRQWINAHDPKQAAGQDSAEVRRVMEVVEKISSQYPVDRGRIYLIAASMGAAGGWQVLTHHPKTFAAAILIAGAGETNDIPLVTDLPMWFHYGGSDVIVKPERIRAKLKALGDAHANYRATEYQGAGHEICFWVWRRKPVVDWLFSQRRTN